jgi:hypothetical protein
MVVKARFFTLRKQRELRISVCWVTGRTYGHNEEKEMIGGERVS